MSLFLPVTDPSVICRKELIRGSLMNMKRHDPLDDYHFRNPDLSLEEILDGIYLLAWVVDEEYILANPKRMDKMFENLNDLNDRIEKIKLDVVKEGLPILFGMKIDYLFASAFGRFMGSMDDVLTKIFENDYQYIDPLIITQTKRMSDSVMQSIKQLSI